MLLKYKLVSKNTFSYQIINRNTCFYFIIYRKIRTKKMYYFNRISCIWFRLNPLNISIVWFTSEVGFSLSAADNSLYPRNLVLSKLSWTDHLNLKPSNPFIKIELNLYPKPHSLLYKPSNTQ